MKEISIFDVIGPNMIGPSSSHTAGAVRIALMARKLIQKPICEVTFVLYGSFAQTYKGHGTDKALVAGILGMDTEDERIRDAFKYAQDAGLQYRFEPDTKEVTDHPNTVKIIAKDETGDVMTVVGASIGGGNIRIDQINGIDVEFTGEYCTMIIKQQDTPGVVAHITQALSEYNINIAFMRLYRESRGTLAYTIIETDELIDEGVQHKIQENSSILKVTII